MIVFNVVKEKHGWAVRMGDRMTTPFWSRDLAIREANTLADSIRSHGEFAQVIIQDPETSEVATSRLETPTAIGLAIAQ
ncbi:MAG TPA: hypothetical protein VGI79_09855 [Caulobacteraceae bacterium]|jgi:hypothetical protein